MSEIYYKTAKDSETGLKIQQLVQKGKEGAEQAAKLCEELGATDNYLINDRYTFGTGLCAFQFPEEPDMKIWKKHYRMNGFYQPRLNNKAGKELDKRITDLPKIEKSEIGEAIGWTAFMSTPGFRIGKKSDSFGFALDSSWKHKMPEDCSEVTGSDYDNL